MKIWERYPLVYNLIQILLTGGFMRPVSLEITEIISTDIMDLGCGTGELIKYIHPKKFIGLDSNIEYIEAAKARFPQFKFYRRDITKDKFPKTSVKYLVIVNVLHHLNDLEVKNLFSNIKKNKVSRKLIIIESKPKGPLSKILEKLDAGDNFRSRKKLKEMVESYFKVNKKTLINAPFRTYDYLILKCTY